MDARVEAEAQAALERSAALGLQRPLAEKAAVGADGAGVRGEDGELQNVGSRVVNASHTFRSVLNAFYCVSPRVAFVL